MRTPEEQLVDASLEIGKALLLAGGEVTRVEDTITRILHAYGMREIGVFTITSLIEVTACTPDGDEIVKARRIAGSYATDLDRVERLNALSREICAQCPPPQTLAARIEAIRRPRTEAAWISYAGAVLTACSFAVFFGGSAADIPARRHTGLPHLLDGPQRLLQEGKSAAVLSALLDADRLSRLRARPHGCRCPPR